MREREIGCDICKSQNNKQTHQIQQCKIKNANIVVICKSTLYQINTN